MSKPMPQEIEVWYLLPALRREIAKILINDHSLSQKKVAKLLGITESAVSQYLKEKRGQEIKFKANDLEKIKDAAKKILDDKANLTKYIYELSVTFRGSKTICELHKKHDENLPDRCDICMEE